MILYITTPWISLLTEWLDLWFRRKWRRKYIYKNQDASKYDKNDLLKYLDLKAGPEYIMDYKIANTTTILFIAIVIGPILPLLYPIGFIALVVQYITEKVSLDRFYRLPKKQDESLTIINIKMLMASPFLALSLSIWAMGNRQMFDNVIDPIQSQGDIVLSHHLIGNWNHMIPDYTHVHMLCIGLVASFVVIAGISVYQYIQWECYDKQRNIRVLPNYTNSLNMQSCEDVYKDEKLFRERGGFKIFSDRAYDKLKDRLK